MTSIDRYQKLSLWYNVSCTVPTSALTTPTYIHPRGTYHNTISFYQEKLITSNPINVENHTSYSSLLSFLNTAILWDERTWRLRLQRRDPIFNMTTSGNLTPPQLRALLDIFVHYETYSEVQSFRHPKSIDTYGWPFVDVDDQGKPVKPHAPSSSPLLQLLLTRLVLDAPAVRELSTDFWPVKFRGIMRQFGNADLSDSYDKGTLGTRKRLATAASVIHESVTRGLLSGVSCDALPNLHRPYHRKNAEDLKRAWHDCICQLVYGNLIDEIFDQLTQTKHLEAHSPGLRAAVEYVEVYLAAFLHQTFIVSAEGPYLLKLIENIHKLIPYTVIGQTLRVGNAASMINAMSRLFLSKVSVGAISNWIGLTSDAADGMNLSE